MEEDLIESVRGKTCLYDVKHPDYMRFELKDNIWKQIARDLKLKDGNVAKRAWEKLRNNHRDALRRQKKTGAAKIRPWRFQQSMEFLVPYMGNRTSHNLVKTENDNYANSIQSENEEIQNEETNQSFEPTDQLTDQIHSEKGTLNRSFKKHEQRYNRQGTRTDPLYHFFMSMYETTKRLPPVSQHNVKTKIFNIVSQVELQNIEQCSSPRPYTNQSQNYDSDGETYDSRSSPMQEQHEIEEITVKDEVPESACYHLDTFN